MPFWIPMDWKNVCPLRSDGAPYIPLDMYDLDRGRHVLVTESPIKAITINGSGAAARAQKAAAALAKVLWPYTESITCRILSGDVGE